MYKGCGISTELLRIQQHIENDFSVLGFSVKLELDNMM